MMFKNLPASSFLWKIPLRIALDSLAAAYSIYKNRNLKDCFAIIGAHYAFVGGIPKLIKKRSGNNPFRCPPIERKHHLVLFYSPEKKIQRPGLKENYRVLREIQWNADYHYHHDKNDIKRRKIIAANSQRGKFTIIFSEPFVP